MRGLGGKGDVVLISQWVSGPALPEFYLSVSCLSASHHNPWRLHHLLYYSCMFFSARLSCCLIFELAVCLSFIFYTWKTPEDPLNLTLLKLSMLSFFLFFLFKHLSHQARAKEAWNHIRTLFSGAAHPLPSDRLQSLGTLVSPQPEQQSFAPSLTVSLLVNVAVFCQLPPSGSAEVLQAVRKTVSLLSFSDYCSIQFLLNAKLSMHNAWNAGP